MSYTHGGKKRYTFYFGNAQAWTKSAPFLCARISFSLHETEAFALNIRYMPAAEDTSMTFDVRASAGLFT